MLENAWQGLVPFRTWLGAERDAVGVCSQGAAHETDTIGSSRIAEEDAIEEQRLKLTQSGNYSWSWHHQGAAAEADRIGQQHAAEADPVREQQLCTESCPAHGRLQVKLLGPEIPGPDVTRTCTLDGYALRLASFPGLPQFILHIDVEEWLVETERPGIIHHMIDADQVDVLGPTTNEFTTGWRTCVDCLGVSTSCGAFEPSQLDDELLQDLLKQLQDLLKQLQAPLFLYPPHINLTTLMWWTPGLPRSLLLFRIRICDSLV